MGSSPGDRIVLPATPTQYGGAPKHGRLSTVDIVVPVRRDDPGMPRRIRELHAIVHDCVPLSWTITMVDVGGAGEPWPWAAHLSEQLAGVHVVRAGHGGRAEALRAAWRHARSDVVVLLELDGPAASDALLSLVVPLVNGRADVAVGTVARRGLYQRLMRFGFGVGDPRGGLLAVRADVLWPLLDQIKDDSAFLITELMLLAKHNRLRVHEVAIGAGRRAPGSLWGHAKALIRLTHGIVTGHADIGAFADREGDSAAFRAVLGMKFVLFGIVGGISGVLYVLVYLPLRDWSSSPAIANFAALVIAALFNAEANRFWTFRKSRVARFGMHVKAAVLFAVHYALTTGAVLVLLLFNPDAGPTAELVTLLSADLMMTIGRFVGLDKWVFRKR